MNEVHVGTERARHGDAGTPVESCRSHVAAERGKTASATKSANSSSDRRGPRPVGRASATRRKAPERQVPTQALDGASEWSERLRQPDQRREPPAEVRDRFPGSGIPRSGQTERVVLDRARDVPWRPVRVAGNVAGRRRRSRTQGLQHRGGSGRHWTPPRPSRNAGRSQASSRRRPKAPAAFPTATAAAIAMRHAALRYAQRSTPRTPKEEDTAARVERHPPKARSPSRGRPKLKECLATSGSSRHDRLHLLGVSPRETRSASPCRRTTTPGRSRSDEPGAAKMRCGTVDRSSLRTPSRLLPYPGRRVPGADVFQRLERTLLPRAVSITRNPRLALRALPGAGVSPDATRRLVNAGRLSQSSRTATPATRTCRRSRDSARLPRAFGTKEIRLLDESLDFHAPFPRGGFAHRGSRNPSRAVGSDPRHTSAPDRAAARLPNRSAEGRASRTAWSSGDPDDGPRLAPRDGRAGEATAGPVSRGLGSITRFSASDPEHPQNVRGAVGARRPYPPAARGGRSSSRSRE